MQEKTAAVVLAAGKGKRMNSDVPKQFMLLREKPDYTASDGWELFGIIKDLIMDQAVPC